MKLVALGDIEKVFMYLRKNDMANVISSVEQKSKRSPLHIATKHGHLHLVEFLLNKGANIEARDKLLKTPLHYACENGHALVVKMLMDNNADPFEKDNCGRSTLHYAVYSGNTDIVDLLAQHAHLASWLHPSPFLCHGHLHPLTSAQHLRLACRHLSWTSTSDRCFIYGLAF